MTSKVGRGLLAQCLKIPRNTPKPSSNARHVNTLAPRGHLCLRTVVPAKVTLRAGQAIRCFSEKPEGHARIEELVAAKPIVVFMKGTPEQPLCGFSNAVCQILRMHGVGPFDSYDVLADEELRQGVKEFSNWPTIPQVYIGGEFVGGCDIMIDMHKNGELIEELKKVGIKSDLDD